MNQRELFLKHVAQTSDTPMMGVDIDIVKAEGSTLTDRNGNEYIDLISGISVSNVGHCHPRVVSAIKNQCDSFMHLMVYGEFNQKPQVSYAEKLCAHLPSHLNSVYFTTSGSEAVEGAIKLAKRVTGRNEIISFKKAYHGSTHGALSIMGDEYFKNAYRPLLPQTKLLNFNCLEDLNFITNETAAVVIEPIQGEAGIRKVTPEFLTALRKKCSDVGALLIFDEIQSGFGRTGKLFAMDWYNIYPDILLIAKGMGGGLPIGAFIASKELMNCFTYNPVLGHINTFGGNAVCVAAAQAALEVIIENELMVKALEIEKIIQNNLSSQVIGELRIHGALGAIDFFDESKNFNHVKKCLLNGIITDWFLFCTTAMRFSPPLTISDLTLKKSIERINRIFETT